jgi:hypothetical protein
MESLIKLKLKWFRVTVVSKVHQVLMEEMDCLDLREKKVTKVLWELSV